MPDIKSRDEIGKQLLTLLRERDISDTALEQGLGLTPKTVSNWRRGISHSYMRLLPEIAEFLDIEMYQLMLLDTVREDTLTADETELLHIYRRAGQLSPSRKRTLRQIFAKITEMAISEKK